MFNMNKNNYEVQLDKKYKTIHKYDIKRLTGEQIKHVTTLKKINTKQLNGLGIKLQNNKLFMRQN